MKAGRNAHHPRRVEPRCHGCKAVVRGSLAAVLLDGIFEHPAGSGAVIEGERLNCGAMSPAAYFD